MEEGSIEELSTIIPITDVMRLIEINMGRIYVFNSKHATLDEITDVSLNGTSIQLTTNSALD